MMFRKGRATNSTGLSFFGEQKGITPVIAVVLLLMITVALIGFAFIWFQGVWTSVSASTEEQILTEVDKMAMTIRIENVNANAGTITIRSTGTKSIPLNQIAVYVGSSLTDLNPVNCTWDVSEISAKGIGTCNATTISTPATIKVVSPGTSQGDVTTVE